MQTSKLYILAVSCALLIAGGIYVGVSVLATPDDLALKAARDKIEYVVPYESETGNQEVLYVYHTDEVVPFGEKEIKEARTETRIVEQLDDNGDGTADFAVTAFLGPQFLYDDETELWYRAGRATTTVEAFNAPQTVWEWLILPAYASDTGFKTAATIVTVGGWSSFTAVNLGTSDNIRASASGISSPGVISTFSFGIPAGATSIDGIEVTVEQSCGSCALDSSEWIYNDVSLSWNSGSTYTSVKTTGTNDSAADVIETLGGSTDTWGRTWAVSEFDDGTFYLKIQMGLVGICTDRVDHIRAKVYYTAASSFNFWHFQDY